MACENCGSDDVRRTPPGTVFDDYLCPDCGHSYSRMSPAAKRIAIMRGIKLLTGGLDEGTFGAPAAELFGGDSAGPT